jgi:hypothetical protein
MTDDQMLQLIVDIYFYHCINDWVDFCSVKNSRALWWWIKWGNKLVVLPLVVVTVPDFGLLEPK